MPIRILVVDEQAVYRTGLRELIAAKVPFVEVFEASSLAQSLSCELRNNVFDLVLVGAGLSNSKALDTLKAAQVALPVTRLAIVSASDRRADILAGLAAGLHGYISKQQSDMEIIAAIGDILAGRIYVPCSLAEPSDAEDGRGDKVGKSLPLTDVIFKLTKRQREVLALLARGKSNKEIARILHIAEATTKIHMVALLRVLGVRNRTEAAFKAASLANLSELGSREPLAPTEPTEEPMDLAVR